MAQKMTAGEALLAQLMSVPEYLRPKDQKVFALMCETAGGLGQGGANDAGLAATIYQMLGGAGGYGDDHPPASVVFPIDHRLHLDCGNEWYWISANLMGGSDGASKKISLLIDMLRIRVISKAVQEQAGWTDAECQVVWNAVTCVIADGAGVRMIRRRPNVQWAAVGGKVAFPDGESFVYSCGPDSMTGSVDVLPLNVVVDDGDNIRFDLNLSTDMPAKTAFFLQGKNGITPDPTPGIYYSWPQLRVEGQIHVEGQQYPMQGTGWIDHQLLAWDTPSPPSFTQPEFSGWNWCQFNFDNGEAYTAAAFQTGAIGTNKLTPYGFYLRRNGGVWDAEYAIGGLTIDNLIPTLHDVFQPTAWNYTAVSLETGAELIVSPAPWILDGSFETPDLAVPSEVPVTVATILRGKAKDGADVIRAIGGAGYCETVGFEPRGLYMTRAVAHLNDAQS
jgi:predicted secreted hydrolase